MLFKPAGNTVSTIIIGYSLLVMAGIFLIRFINKNKSPDKSNRRQMPRLRLALNILLLAALSGTIALIGWDVLSFLKFENAPLYIRFAIGFSAFYIWLLSMAIAFNRFRSKSKSPRAAGEERRQHHWLRRILNFSMAASAVVVGAAIIYNLLR
jgi:uncharacterized membrane protein